MPTVTRGNTHAPAVMIGERCAELIRAGAGGARAASSAAAAVPVT
jgi:choline dehydrogenase